MLCCEIVENYRRRGKIDVDESAHRIKQSFIDHYDHLVSILKEDERLEKLLQILFGPAIDVKGYEVDEFLRYGLIKQGPKDEYTGYSEHFHTFLNIVQREMDYPTKRDDLWTLIGKTERGLRKLISTKLCELYGERWITKAENAHQKLKEIFEGARKRREQEEKNFGSRASQNLLDFTYFNELFAIISSHWKNVFQNVFNMEKNYWGQRFDLLAMVRTPLAHHRPEALDDHQKLTAEGYCREILKLIGE
jgi:hypothetical protein